VPRALSDVVARCLARDRDQRIGSAADWPALYLRATARAAVQSGRDDRAMLGGRDRAALMTPPGRQPRLRDADAAAQSATPPAQSGDTAGRRWRRRG